MFTTEETYVKMSHVSVSIYALFIKVQGHIDLVHQSSGLHYL